MPTYRIHIEYPEDPHALKTQTDPEGLAKLKHLATLPRRHPEVLAYLQKHRILVWGENDWNSPWFRGNIQTADGMQLYFWNKGGASIKSPICLYGWGKFYKPRAKKLYPTIDSGLVISYIHYR